MSASRRPTTCSTNWKAAKRDKIDTPEGIQKALADVLHETLLPLEQPLDVSGHKPFVIMIAGVNGAGKTTSIGKLAKHFQTQGKSVLLAAGDTFRAAAREQLETWGERNNVTVIAQDIGRSGGRRLRRHLGGQGARHRHRAGRHRRPPADADCT